MDFLRKAASKAASAVLGPSLAPDKTFENYRKKLDRLSEMIIVLERNMQAYAGTVIETSKAACSVGKDIAQFYAKSTYSQGPIKLFSDTQFAMDDVIFSIFSDDFDSDIHTVFREWKEDILIVKRKVRSAEKVRIDVSILQSRMKALEARGTAADASELEQVRSDTARATSMYKEMCQTLHQTVKTNVDSRFATFDRCFVRLMEMQLEYFRAGAENTAAFMANIENYRQRHPRRASSNKAHSNDEAAIGLQKRGATFHSIDDDGVSDDDDDVIAQEGKDTVDVPSVPPRPAPRPAPKHKAKVKAAKSKQKHRPQQQSEPVLDILNGAFSDTNDNAADTKSEPSDSQGNGVQGRAMLTKTNSMPSFGSVRDGESPAFLFDPVIEEEDEQQQQQQQQQHQQQQQQQKQGSPQPPPRHNARNGEVSVDELFGMSPPSAAQHQTPLAAPQDVFDMLSPMASAPPSSAAGATVPGLNISIDPLSLADQGKEKARKHKMSVVSEFDDFDPCGSSAVSPADTPRGPVAAAGPNGGGGGESFAVDSHEFPGLQMEEEGKGRPALRVKSDTEKASERADYESNKKPGQTMLEYTIAKNQEETLKRMNDGIAKQERDIDAQRDCADVLGPRLDAWEYSSGVKRKLRSLLSSMHTVLWDEAKAKWTPPSLGDLIDAGYVKRSYRKAVLRVHVDKIPSTASAEVKYTARRIFEGLNQAWIRFEETGE